MGDGVYLRSDFVDVTCCAQGLLNSVKQHRQQLLRDLHFLFGFLHHDDRAGS